MRIRALPYRLTVCKLDRMPARISGFFSLTSTGEEISLVCESDCAPHEPLVREDGWRAFMVEGPLEFSLVGILAEISGCLAEKGIPLFAISTFDTDYLLVKEGDFDAALDSLREKGNSIIG